MSRFTFQQKPRPKKAGPIWQGIGLIVFFVLTVGGYLLTGWLIDLNAQQSFLPFALPVNFKIPVGKLFEIPGRVFIQVAVTLFLDVVLFSVMTVIYGMLNPIKDEMPDPETGFYRQRR